MTVFIDPCNLPSVHLSELKKLPNCTAIYFAIDSKDRVLYVGKATNLTARWKSHHRAYKLEEIDRSFSVRISWQPWNEEDLNEAEKYFIKQFQPLLNGTEVESPAIIPSEIILREFLKSLSQRLIIVGIQPRTTNELPNVYLKYDWKDCSSRGTAAKIRNFIQRNKDKNTSLKFKRKKYARIIPPMVIRPGSREQKENARENRSYNNHWQIACNGVIVNITPTNYYQALKSRIAPKKLAGVKLQAITEVGLLEMSSKSSYEFSGLSYFESDPIPLLWINK